MNATRPNASVTIPGPSLKSIGPGPAEPAASGETRIIVIDANRRFLRASEAGKRMLSSESALRLSMDRVRGVSQVDDTRLEWAVAVAAAGQIVDQSLPIGPRGSGLSLAIVALFSTGAEPELMLMIRDSREERRRALSRAAAFFGFTSAETRLVSALYEGCSVPDAAGRLGVAPTTARSHLQSVFAKTGVRRQGDLINFLTNPSALAVA